MLTDKRRKVKYNQTLSDQTPISEIVLTNAEEDTKLMVKNYYYKRYENNA